MAIFKCKMCGGSLAITAGTTVCECEYCGSQQTLPKDHNDVLANLFNRANNLRIKSEFDKAQEIYEKIVSQNPTESEAYWGIILCKYGIEYVEDPATFSKIPTCHRTLLESIKTDVDYLAALEHADPAQRSLYETEAAVIDRLQKDILALVREEEPFDVFICYKESDDDGRRTTDSVIANDIYHHLTQEGFKVFYAAITLEDKIGREYEPYIFAALNSAKVMLVIGSRPEYFQAPWVRNEWSRYFKLMKSDRSKLLIPCYKDMDAYDLPDEFAHLQAQDMGKIGFLNDLIRGIKKVIVRDEPKQSAAKADIPTKPERQKEDPAAALLMKATVFLEDSVWEKADEYAKKALELNPESAEGYLIRLMVHKNIAGKAQLPNYVGFLQHRKYYPKIMEYGDEKLRREMEEYSKAAMYREAERRFRCCETPEEFDEVAELFGRMEGYRESQKQMQRCRDKSTELRYSAYVSEFDAASTAGEYEKLRDAFTAIRTYKSAETYIERCEQKLKQLRKAEQQKSDQSNDDSMGESGIHLDFGIRKKKRVSFWKRISPSYWMYHPIRCIVCFVLIVIEFIVGGLLIHQRIADGQSTLVMVLIVYAVNGLLALLIDSAIHGTGNWDDRILESFPEFLIAGVIIAVLSTAGHVFWIVKVSGFAAAVIKHALIILLCGTAGFFVGASVGAGVDIVLYMR